MIYFEQDKIFAVKKSEKTEIIMTKAELEAFLAVLQYGSISAAAERLFITQPAMSRRMKSMEEELGYSLFERGRGQRSVELTENGKEFVPVAERLLTLYREAEEIPRRKKSPLLRVSTVNSIAFYLMPAVLKEMMSARDTCSIEFKTGRSSDIYGYVENGSVDVALVSDLLNSRRIVPFPVFREPFVFAGGESWRETGRVTPDMLDPEEQIRLPWNPEYDIWHSRWFPPDANPSLTADKMEFLEYFLNGKKWAVIPLLVARRFKRQDVWICPMEGGPEDMTIYGLTKENRMDDQIRRFFQCVREELQMIDGIELFSGR